MINLENRLSATLSSMKEKQNIADLCGSETKLLQKFDVALDRAYDNALFATFIRSYGKEAVERSFYALYVYNDKKALHLNRKEMRDMLDQSLKAKLLIDGYDAFVIKYKGTPTFVPEYKGLIRILNNHFGGHGVFVTVYTEDEIDILKKTTPKYREQVITSDPEFLRKRVRKIDAKELSVVQVGMNESTYRNFTIGELDHKTEKVRNNPNSPWKTHTIEMYKKTAVKAFFKEQQIPNVDYTALYNPIEDDIIENKQNIEV